VPTRRLPGRGLTVVEIFVLGWGEVAALGVQALLVVPVDALQWDVLDVVEAAPGTAPATARRSE
jgi:hypothetical protein